ncbi:hypothetical protein CEXT_98541 [Caerostris extrusa]|uniref:Uncharacterized protein n=1 Tax=Caerostris extrusa TaxID=172846 RepID=A0AAV4XJV8_CAEEX|nr:hypothetical protein CEXT_98541 [Caerostris extrusa]
MLRGQDNFRISLFRRTCRINNSRGWVCEEISRNENGVATDLGGGERAENGGCNFRQKQSSSLRTFLRTVDLINIPFTYPPLQCTPQQGIPSVKPIVMYLVECYTLDRHYPGKRDLEPRLALPISPGWDRGGPI